MNLLTSYMTYLPLAPVPHLPGTSLDHMHNNFSATVEKMPDLSFRCMDIGLDCPFEVKGKTKTQLMREFIEHAESTHNIPVLSAETLLKIKDSLNK
jgi:predicted small metal-binding protein